jgi:hypothetical protein
VSVGAVDRGEVVDERAIEIEEKGAERHERGKIGGGDWRDARKFSGEVRFGVLLWRASVTTEGRCPT